MFRKWNIFKTLCNKQIFKILKDGICFLLINKQESHGPHRSPEKPVQINKHI